LRQNAPTALLNLTKDYITFKQNKALHDQIVKEFPVQLETMSPTPYTDIITQSPYFKEINKKAKEDQEKFDKLHSEAIQAMKEKRKSDSKGKKP
jgi:hypothetical protein